MKKKKIFSLMMLLCLLIFPLTLFAYIGPGTGLSAIGSFLALLGGVVIAILGFFWYPIKRLIGRNKSREPKTHNNS
jgi:hypothetical protein